MNNIKKFLPLIITSSVLVIAIIANIITAGVNVDDLPDITYDDIPTSDGAYSEYQAAQRQYDSINGNISDIDKQISKNQEEIEKHNEEITKLNASIEELKTQQLDISDFSERYEKCLKEAQRLNSMWEVYSDMKVGKVYANYDVNNLRANQNNSNIYSVISEYTGFFGQILSDSINTGIYNGFDKIIAAVNIITNTLNEHIYSADILISKIQTKISNADALLTEELSGESLMFELELFESAYFGNDELFEAERTQLVYELSNAKAVIDAVYPVYQMMLSDSDENAQFLADLRNKSTVIGDYLSKISKSESELLSQEDVGKITYDAYQLIPMICDVTTDPTFLYKDVRIVGPIRIANGLGYKPDQLYQGIKNESYTFVLRQYKEGRTKLKNAYYYAPGGNLLYAEYGADQVCLINGTVVYSSNESRTDSIIQEAKSYYEKYN